MFTERAQVPDPPENKKKMALSLIGPLAGLALGLLLAGLRGQQLDPGNGERS